MSMKAAGQWTEGLNTRNKIHIEKNKERILYNYYICQRKLTNNSLEISSAHYKYNGNLKKKLENLKVQFN